LKKYPIILAGLVHDIKVGRERLWKFEPTQLNEAQRLLANISKQWNEALERLRNMVE